MPGKDCQGVRTTLGSRVKAIGRALEAAGCDSAALLAEAGFDLKSLDGPTVRCPLTQTERLWRLAVAATHDPAFGIKVASHIKQTTFHALSYGLSASSTLKEASPRRALASYCHVASDAIEYNFFRSGEEYHFVIEPAASVADESVDALVAAYLRMCRSLLGHDYSPLRIEFRRARPAKIEDFIACSRGCTFPVRRRLRLVFDCAAIRRPLDGGNPELARHNDAIALRYLSQIERDNIQGRVRAVLTRRLAPWRALPEDVAELLGMTPHAAQLCGGRYAKDLQTGGVPPRLAGLSPARLFFVSERDYLLGFRPAFTPRPRISPLDRPVAVGLACGCEAGCGAGRQAPAPRRPSWSAAPRSLGA